MRGEGGPTPFDRQMAVVPAPGRPGTYLAEVSDQWNAPVQPQGGITAALALRAMEVELAAPHERLRTATALFVGQVPVGPVEIDVAVLRRGRSMSQAMATVHPVGATAGHTVVGAFGVERPGFAFTSLRPPDVLGPEAYPGFRDPPDGWEWEHHATFWDQVDRRVVSGHFPWDQDWEPTGAELVVWQRFDETPRLEDHTVDPLALVAHADTMPGAAFQRIASKLRNVFVPSVDLTVHILGDARSDWLLGVNRARHAGGGYCSLDMEWWDPEEGLVAYATQMMLFSFPDGPPAPEDLEVPPLAAP